MTKYPTSRDLAATMLFARSYVSLKAMIKDTIQALADQFPKLSRGRKLKVGFFSDQNLYWGWFSFSKVYFGEGSERRSALGSRCKPLKVQE